MNLIKMGFVYLFFEKNVKETLFVRVYLSLICNLIFIFLNFCLYLKLNGIPIILCLYLYCKNCLKGLVRIFLIPMF